MSDDDSKTINTKRIGWARLQQGKTKEYLNNALAVNRLQKQHTTNRDKINLKWNSILEEHMIEKFTVSVDDMTQENHFFDFSDFLGPRFLDH